jgi:Tol biopolymer transport system component
MMALFGGWPKGLLVCLLGALALQGVTSARSYPTTQTLPAGAVVRMDIGHGQSEGAVLGVAFSADGKTLASSSRDGTIGIWEAATGKELRQIQGHRGLVKSVVFSPDGKTLASAGADKTVRLWLVASGKELLLLKGHTSGVEAVAFSADGKTLASSSEDGVRLWDPSDGKQLRTIPNPRRVTALAFAADGKTLAGGSTDRQVHLWDPATGKEQRRLRAYAWVHIVAFSTDGKLIAAGGRDQLVHVWEAATGEKVAEMDGYHGEIAAVAFSPDGKTVASGHKDRTVRLWEVNSRKLRRQFDMPQGPVFALTFAPDGKTLAAGSEGPGLIIWDVTGGQREVRQQGKLTPKEQEVLWTELGSSDAGRAYQAMWTLAAEPRQTIRLLQEHLMPILALSVEVPRLVADLDSKQFSVRDRASQRLREVAELAEPLLRAALREQPTLEVRRRIELVLARVENRCDEPRFSSRDRVLRAIETLEYIGTADARKLLEALAGELPDPRLKHMARASLTRLQVH